MAVAMDGDSHAMRSLAERIQRQRIAAGNEDEKVLLKPWDVDRVVRALMFASTVKHAFGELGRDAGPGEWPAREGEIGFGG